MKKTFPGIIILITLSLFGLIWLQVSWLRNLLQLRESQLLTKLNEVAATVANDMSKVVYGGQSIRPQRRGGMRLGSEFPLYVPRPLTIKEKFSLQDVTNRLNRAFDIEEIKNTRFEFAVLNSNADFEMGTTNFEKESDDTINNRQLIVPIIPDFEVANWFTSTSPESRFVLTLTAQRSTPEARFVLRDLELTVSGRDGAHARTVPREALIPLLHDTFLIDLPADTRFRSLDAPASQAG